MAMPNQYTNGKILNQSPATAQYITKKDWQGHIKTQFPKTIQSKKNGEFKHENKDAGAEGDVAAVVYRSKKDGVEYDWVFAWFNSFNQTVEGNSVYTDIIKSTSAHYDDGYWEKVKQDLELNSNKVAITKFGCQSVASITDELPSQFNGSIITLDD